MSVEESRMRKNSLNILIGGEAGQGLVTIGQALSRSLVRSGYSIVVTQSYQSRIRGGHNTFTIRVGVDEVSAPREPVDLLVALDRETVHLHREDLSADGLIMLDSTLKINSDKLLRVPFRELAKEKFTNTVALGVAGSLLGLEEDVILGGLESFLDKKDATLAEENRQVLVAAHRWGIAHATSDYNLPGGAGTHQRLMMNGNEAIALGAVSAGLRFCSFYPMTPSTSIVLTLAGWAHRLGLIVEQAEDEIAAINMVLGASFAGAPGMVSTSGGGFALMVEGVSLAAMTETPVVIVVAQRPGPATGLPTRTEQADLEFVLHSGHGEFPRVLFAPGTVEECFYLTCKAFALAERYQGPVFILTDQFLADSYRAVMPFDMEDSPSVDIRDQGIGASSYKRYMINESGVSPRLTPGTTKHLVVADSDEHTEEGHITEDLILRKLMVEKRLRKGRGIRSEVIPPQMEGDERADFLLISWGSSKGSVFEAASIMAENGEHVATLHFNQIWPIVPEQFMKRIQAAKRVVCIEGNATGQLARLIRRETGFHIKEAVLRYDGLPMTPEYILSALRP
jgi:2-oxoglutarate ferredoxin oxidoreductase subunit alpha